MGRGCLIVFLCTLCLCSCRSVRTEYVPIMQIRSDTLIQYKERVDSVWMYDSVHVREGVIRCGWTDGMCVWNGIRHATPSISTRPTVFLSHTPWSVRLHGGSVPSKTGVAGRCLWQAWLLCLSCVGGIDNSSNHYGCAD